MNFEKDTLAEEVAGLNIQIEQLSAQIAEKEQFADSLELGTNTDPQYEAPITLDWEARLTNIVRAIEVMGKTRSEDLPPLREERDQLQERANRTLALLKVYDQLDFARAGQTAIVNACDSGHWKKDDQVWISTIISQLEAGVMDAEHGYRQAKGLLNEDGDLVVKLHGIEQPDSNNFFHRTDELLTEKFKRASRSRIWSAMAGEEFHQVIRKLSDLFRGGILDGTPAMDGLYHSFRGQLFEQISYQEVIKGLRSSVMILSPGETFHLYTLIYPDRPVMEDRLGQGMQGITVPDGIMLGNTAAGLRVYAVCEYTAQDMSREGVKEAQRKILGSGVINRDFKRFIEKESGRNPHFSPAAFEYVLKLANQRFSKVARNIYADDQLQIGYVVLGREQKIKVDGAQVSFTDYDSQLFDDLASTVFNELYEYYKLNGKINVRFFK